jgi:hypothetical protein
MQRSAEEIAILKRFASAPPNVREAFSLYDSLLIAPTFYGNEANVQGWFTSFAAFGAENRHSLFKNRTWAQAGLCYCNQNNADSLDYAFVADSIGVAIWGPPDTLEAQDNAGAIQFPDYMVCPWFLMEAVHSMAISFKVQQDVRMEAFVQHVPAGYGPQGNGTAMGQTNEVAPAFGQMPYQHMTVNHGLPIMSNRYPFPSPIGIPRTATIEATLHVGDLARGDLQAIDGPRQYVQNSDDGAAPRTFFDRRYVIQVSLFGTRLVQQRALYHR